MMKVVIFDFDGTLANSYPWFIKRINHIAKVMNFNPVKPEDVEVLRKSDVDEILKYLGISSFKLPLVILYMKWLMSKESKEIELFPEVLSLLDTLKKAGIEILILSSNSKKNVKSILGEGAKLVSAFYCGAGLQGKDAHFKKIKRDYPQGSFLSVGDERRDLMAAKKVEVDHLNVTWGYADACVFSDEEVINSFTDLERRILRHFDEKGRSLS